MQIILWVFLNVYSVYSLGVQFCSLYDIPYYVKNGIVGDKLESLTDSSSIDLGDIKNNGIIFSDKKITLTNKACQFSTVMFALKVSSDSKSFGSLVTLNDGKVLDCKLNYRIDQRIYLMVDCEDLINTSGGHSLDLISFHTPPSEFILAVAFSFYRLENNIIGIALSIKGKEGDGYFNNYAEALLPLGIDYNKLEVHFTPQNFKVYYIVTIKEVMDLASLDEVAGSLDLDSSIASNIPSCNSNAYLTGILGTTRQYVCSDVADTVFNSDFDQCINIAEVCVEYCTREYTYSDFTECYEKCASTYIAANSNGNFYRCREPIARSSSRKKRSRGTGFYLLVILLPILLVAIGVGVLLWLTNCFGFLKNEDNAEDTGTIGLGNVIESFPNKVTNLGGNNEYNIGGEAGMNEAKHSIIASRNYLDSSSLQIIIPRDIPEQKTDLIQAKSATIQFAMCAKCNMNNVAPSPVFSCGHQNLCVGCSGQEMACLICGNGNKVA